MQRRGSLFIVTPFNCGIGEGERFRCLLLGIHKGGLGSFSRRVNVDKGIVVQVALEAGYVHVHGRERGARKGGLEGVS